MKGSFVFHESYLKNVPEKDKAKWMLYVVEYGLYGKNPPIEKETFEYKAWADIAERIDKEFEDYKKVCEKRRAAAQKRYSQHFNNQETKLQVEEKKAETQTENTKTQEKKHTTFTKPTVEEIDEYCKERKNNIEAQTFYDFYESKGWFIGDRKMKDWKAAVRNWENRRKEETSHSGKSSGIWGKENEVPDELVNMF